MSTKSTNTDHTNSLHKLAEQVGLQRVWRAVDGIENVVSDETITSILSALGYLATSDADVALSFAKAEAKRHIAPRLITTEVGMPTRLPSSLGLVTLTSEDGSSREVKVDRTLPPIHEPGYYQLNFGGLTITLAVCPSKFQDLQRYRKRLWGSSIQIPALRNRNQRPFGNFRDLDDAVRIFADKGADAIMINPVHALFPGHGVGYSPYSPSSRLFLNGAMGDPTLLGLESLPDRDSSDFVDWETALPQHLHDMRNVFERLDQSQRDQIARDSNNMGQYLKRHALFDALYVSFQKEGFNGWEEWPEPFQNPESDEVRQFAETEQHEIEFHTFVQWTAANGLSSVQQHAKKLGMQVGLIADLAVGVHTGGSDMWAMRQYMLNDLTIGAPPDPFGPLGQNWLLSSFSPQGLKDSGFAPWIEMIRATFRYAGGVRIDHAFGLARLWVVPKDAPSSQGAYLTYPFDDLIRLAALEAHRADALVVAEDLGTKPLGFSDALAARQMLGTRVLWYERAADGGFIGPQDYDLGSLAMTSTHDSPTIAGWWSGYDIDLANSLSRFPVGYSLEQSESERAWDRGLLWSTLDHTLPRPKPEDVAPVVDASLRHLGRSNSLVAIAPVEDLLGIKEQPNLPGTITEHPNWRRRLPLPIGELLDRPEVMKRVAILASSRVEETASHRQRDEPSRDQ